MKTKLKSNSGFTIVEALLATAIMAFVLCGIIATYLTCLYLITTSKNLNAATNAGQGVIEEIRSTPFPQIIDDFDGMTFTVNDIPSSIGLVDIDDSINSEFFNVTVSISWPQGNNTLTLPLQTQVVNR